MLYLISLFLISGLFIGCLLIISTNYEVIINNLKTNRFTQVLLLEESSYVVPYVIQKYYSYIIDIRSNIIPSIFTTSYWFENTELIKDKELKHQNELRINILKRISLTLALILYTLIIFFWLKYKITILIYQFLINTGFKDQIWSLDVILGVDSLSIPFLVLIGFILPLVYLSNWTTIDHLPTQYYMIIILLEIFLIIVFLVIDLIMFYVFFESILPPLFVLIGLYGASQKFRAGYYLFLYTLFGSLFMLLIFVKMGSDTATSFFIGYTNHNGFTEWQVIIWVILFVSFSVKTPLLPVHIWLPLAHSDANVSGSIILASIVLKLALYGFIRILIAIFFIGTAWLTPFILGLCSISVAYSSFTTIRQFDLKVLVAYSSIAHMASSLLGTFSDTLYGLIGSIIFGLAHGFVSPGLFLIVGAVLYDRCGSRIINYYRGLNAILPFLALIFLILVFGNMGVPLTGNFIGEFLSLIGAYQQNIFIASIGALSIILSAVYSIFMYNRVTSGSISPYIHSIPDIFRKEYYILIPLILLTIILGIYPSFISADIEFGLSNFLFMTSLPFFTNSKSNPNINILLNSSSINKNNKNCKIENEIPLSELKNIDKKSKNNLKLNILDNYINNFIIGSKKSKSIENLIKAIVPWKDKPNFLYIISKDGFKLLRKKFFILVIFIFLPWLITTYPHLLGIDIEFGLSHFLLTGNLWSTMAALTFEKAEKKSKTLHRNANNPHTTPVVEKAVPDIGDNNNRNDQDSTDLVNSDNKSNVGNTANKSNTVNTENKLISTDSTDTENSKDIEKDKNEENIDKNEESRDKNEESRDKNKENTAKNENEENIDKNENKQNVDKNEKTENSLKEENNDSSENKVESGNIKNQINPVNSENDSSELDRGVQNINLNDQSQTVGLPHSKEGTSRFVGLNDKENQPVDAAELRNKIEKLPKIIETEKSSYIQNKIIDKYNSMTAEEYKIYCENNTTKPSTNPEIPQDKIINVVKWPLNREEDSDDDSSRRPETESSVSRTITSPESSSSTSTKCVDTSFVDEKIKPIHGLNDNNIDYSIYDILKMNFSFEDLLFFINQINLSGGNISVWKYFILFIFFLFYTMKFYALYLTIKSNKEEINMIFLKFKYICSNFKNKIKKYLF